MDQLAREYNALNKEIGTKAKLKEDITAEKEQSNQLKAKKESLTAQENEIKAKLDQTLHLIGNLVHDSVIVSNDEEQNEIVRTWGKIPDIKVDSTPGKCHHHDVLAMIDGYDPKRGQKIAGHRGYFLKGMGAILNMGLINYGLQFLMKRGFTPLQTPFFMKKDIMAETCQLSDFDDQLYKVTTGKEADEEGNGEFYLIATSEQPISAYFFRERLDLKDLPIRFAGNSTCFRKEAGAHGKDTWGIFRIHQFEKIEQFVITDPESSWQEHENMIKVSEEFYQSLGLPYRVVSIVSGALNDAAAKKYDLEAWFPGYDTFRELVSCSNCTDFQSRGLDIKLNPVKGEKEPPYVHMLNSTLCATQRTLCCILENYQTADGVVVPEVLRPYVGTDFIPYTKPVPKKEAK